ncbi:MAG: hypothetical protein KFF68_06950 [Desulfosarcina sp.]|nr:hypothetical protein [Desulfosarcina sp.]
MKEVQHLVRLLMIIAVMAGLVFTGCAGPKPKPGEVFPCAADSKIEKTIAPEAELADFSCVVKAWEGADTLHFNVAIKNISDQAQRYRVNIFLDNDKAVGGLIPQSTKKGLVEPGQTAAFEYPVSGMNRGPKSIVLMVKTISE